MDLSTAEERHLDHLQDLISRMAENSAKCKSWCITLISALLAVAVQQSDQSLAYLTFLPIALFFYLDSYYLSLERDFVTLYSSSAALLRQGESLGENLLSLSPTPKSSNRLRKIVRASFSSASTWPVYGSLLVVSAVLGLR